LEAEGMPGVFVYRTKKMVFGAERIVLVTDNERLFLAQSQTLLREIDRRQTALRELQARLRRHQENTVRGGKTPTVEGVRKKIDELLKARHMRDLFNVEITEVKNLPKLTYRFDQGAWRRLQRSLLGKTILFTDNHEWSDVEIVKAYRAQHHVETAFRCMKDPHHLSLRPQHHWTDQKIEVHVFYCVIALMLCSLLVRELHKKGIVASPRHALNRLAEISEVSVLYPPRRADAEPILKTTLSSLSREQKQMYEALGLASYVSA
jgi:transposase